MNKNILLMGCLIMFLGVTPQLNADVGHVITQVSSGVLEDVSTADNTVVFHGKKYQYKINTKPSVLAVDEAELKVLNINDLKPGENYFYEAISFAKNKGLLSNASDFKEIIFITDTKPMVEE